MSESSEGQCACGKVQFQFEGAPLNTAFCYCKECQQHSGTDKYFGVWVANNQFKLMQGEPALFTRVGDSGKNVNHYFCKDCGTNLYIEVTVADMVSIAAGTLANNDHLSPNIVIYAASAPSWAVFPEGVPRFDKLPPQV